MRHRLNRVGLRRLVVGLSVLSILFLAPTLSAMAGSNETFPSIIPLPDGFQPEGIAVGRGHSFYVGSLGDGSVFGGDLRTGAGGIVVPAQDNRIAVGLKLDPRTNYLFVAGGPNGQGYVYDAHTGESLAVYDFTPPNTGFVNDVVVTRDAAFFTDSFQPILYKVPLGPSGALVDASQVEVISLAGDWDQVAGFNANGIDATPDGKTLVLVNSTVGALYRVEPMTGVAVKIDLGNEVVTAGDGILLEGRKVYVMRNQLNQIAVVLLDPKMNTGTVVDSLTDTNFDVPTTIAAFGDDIYAVNARFGTPPTPDTEYDVVRVSKH